VSDVKREGGAASNAARLPRRWAEWFGLNASTAALLTAILFITASTEIWSPLAPEYIKKLRDESGAATATTILLIALWGCYRDLLEAVNYYIGGAVGGWLNTRRSLLLFNLLPLLGLAMLLTWHSPVALFVAAPVLFVWDSIAGPAIITVVGSSVAAERRTMMFSLQSIFRRAARGMVYLVGVVTILTLGRESAFRANVGIAIVLVLAACAIQFRFMRTVERDAAPLLHRPLQALRAFDPQLKRLLAADVLARWAEGMPRELIILFSIPLLAADRDVGAAKYSSLLMVQAATNVVLYLLIGPLASRSGLAKKPYIGLTFVAFALFPLSLAVLGPAMGWFGLMLAFVVAGLREIGEPARKAMISELVDPANRTQAVGLYWSARSVAVMPAPLAGGLLWVLGEWVHPGRGPALMLAASGVVGLLGATFFFRRFGGDT